VALHANSVTGPREDLAEVFQRFQWIAEAIGIVAVAEDQGRPARPVRVERLDRPRYCGIRGTEKGLGGVPVH